MAKSDRIFMKVLTEPYLWRKNYPLNFESRVDS